MSRISLMSLHLLAYLSLLFLAGLPDPVLVASLVLSAILIAISYRDFLTFEIPDLLNLALVVSGLAATWILIPQELFHHTLAVVAWGLFFWGLSTVFLKFRGYNGLGLGDAKLAAGIGAWLGFLPVISVILIASLTAILFLVVVARLQNTPVQSLPIAFGPFLCFTTWWIWVFGPICLWCM